MDEHKNLDKEYHARIAHIYDYITNEPRQYPNELLFRPIDRLIRPAETMLDLGCGTGQMFMRYWNIADRIIAVDHSSAMIEEARKKADGAGVSTITFVEQDLDEFLQLNANLRVDLITCVGVLHHLDQGGLLDFLNAVFRMLNDNGQLVIAEPIYADSVPPIINARNSRSILVSRLEECMPPDTRDPDEEPLHEPNLLQAVVDAGFRIKKRSKGFELFHVTDPISLLERFMITLIYWRYRHRGDVIAFLLEKSEAERTLPIRGQD